MNLASWVSWSLELTTGGDRKALIRFGLFNTHRSVCPHVRCSPTVASAGARGRAAGGLGAVSPGASPFAFGLYGVCSFYLEPTWQEAAESRRLPSSPAAGQGAPRGQRGSRRQPRQVDSCASQPRSQQRQSVRSLEDPLGVGARGSDSAVTQR